jgi:NDP-sugar pyrophosphorylase family protein
MGGSGRRFIDAGYREPKPLIPVGGRPMVSRLLESFPSDWPRTFICNRDHLSGSDLAEVLVRESPGCRIVGIPPHKEGPVHTLLQGMDLDPDCVPGDEPCLVSYCDYGFHWDPGAFADFTRATGCDGAILCYTGFHPEYLRPTMYAYCREYEGRVAEVREKGHFTPDRTREWASSGGYWFRSGDLMRSMCARHAAKGPRISGESYVSLVFNELIRDGLDVRVFPIEWFLQWGTPQDLRDHEYWTGILGRAAQAGSTGSAVKECQVLMPMAGRGSRFPGEVPKPLLPVLGQPMFRAAMEALPATGDRILVVLDEHAEGIRRAAPEATLVRLSAVTEGQALTVAAGIPALDPLHPVLVSNCDHGLVLDQARWDALVDEDPDVVVVGVRGYPGADRTPSAFAWIRADGNRVTGISCKVPLGPDPRGDLLLCGTFRFRRPQMLARAIDELVRRDLRVNGEFYLDTAIEVCIDMGMDVRVFEADGWLCWGTPEALMEYEWWHGYVSGPGEDRYGALKAWQP